ncbi:DUF4440 domain-containing protein [Antarcticibacterium flavum]|uniref:DUF4440 domain-containing protein n=1 Tax=Antarcticibacterium flavum TaxID=2058175 RepID=A0A5B7X6J4_9FLAO|nr:MULTISPECIES: DUF4440 domain-containing protein [Antarcticibacterium]MCM4158524.1 hypothetical protein [Antarcticibacterium sp. W02-3]QCY70271.1 DUF4440 domain-containing protein [Antarcticibacterium flavum]
MRDLKRVVVLFVMLLLGFSFPAAVQAQSSESNSNVKSAIEEVYRDFAKHFKDGNAAAIVENYYTSDAKLYPPQGGVATGQSEIEGMLDGVISAGINLDLEIKELEVFGNMAYEYGVANILNEQGEQLAQNEYVVIWKKDRGTWKIYRDFIKDSAAN